MKMVIISDNPEEAVREFFKYAIITLEQGR